jgi:imidazolonepropionase-like amidohydrolase
MTQFEALVSIAQTMLRMRGQWHANGATAFADINLAVEQAADLLDNIEAIGHDTIAAAKRELKQRAAPANIEHYR